MSFLLVCRLSNDTRTLDTLDEVTLAEQVDNDQRQDNHESAGIAYCVCIGILDLICHRQVLHQLGNVDNVRHQVQLILHIREE